MEPHRREALLAWWIFPALEKVRSLLFDRYEREFQDFPWEEEEASLREDFFSAAQAQATTSLEVGEGPLSPLASGRSEE